LLQFGIPDKVVQLVVWNFANEGIALFQMEGGVDGPLLRLLFDISQVSEGGLLVGDLGLNAGVLVGPEELVAVEVLDGDEVAVGVGAEGVRVVLFEALNNL